MNTITLLTLIIIVLLAVIGIVFLIFKFWGYKIAKFAVTFFMKNFFKLELTGLENIPTDSAAIIAGNHSCWWDTLILSAATKRPLWFLTGEFIFNVPVLSEIVKHLCIIPIFPKKGEEGLKNAVEHLNKGDLVVIFPEGELTPDGDMHRFRNGVSMLYRMSKIPVVPFYIKGGYESWSWGVKKPKFFVPIKLTVGKPMTFDTDNLKEITTAIQNEVASMNK